MKILSWIKNKQGNGSCSKTNYAVYFKTLNFF